MKKLISLTLIAFLYGPLLFSQTLNQPSLSISDYSDSHVTLSWTDNATNETGWIIEREEGSNWSLWDNPVVFDLPANTTFV
jgi:hypothetical protein